MPLQPVRVIAGIIAGEEMESPVIAEFFRDKPKGDITISSRILGHGVISKRLDTQSSWAASVVYGVYFKGAIHTSIILSSILLGFQADAHLYGDDSHLMWWLSEVIFTCIFFVEMLLKIYVMRSVYFTHSWCLMDFVIAWISVADTMLLPLVSQTGEAHFDLHVFKAFRLMRLFRMLKVLKVVPELRMVVEGLAASMRALSWVTLLLFIVLYAFSILCVEIVGNSDVYPGYNRTVSIQAFNNFEYFGSLSRSILSLISITFLAEWNAIRPVWELQWPMMFVFMVFIFITSFGIINVIIGVIVERITDSMQQTQVEQAVLHKERMMQKFDFVAEKLFHHDVEDKQSIDGEEHQVSREDMRTIAERPDILNLLEHVDFPAGFTFDDLFTMLNVDGVGNVRKAEFLTGMQRLVFGNQFQRTCISHLSLGQIKELIQMLWTDQEQQLGHIQRELSELRSCTTQVLAMVRKQADPHVKPATAAPAAQARDSKKRPPALSESALGFLAVGRSESWASSPPPSPMPTCREWAGRQHILLSTKHGDSPPRMLARSLGSDASPLGRDSTGGSVEKALSEASVGSGLRTSREHRDAGTPAVHVAETFLSPLRLLGGDSASIRTEASCQSSVFSVVPVPEGVAEESRAHAAREFSSSASRSYSVGPCNGSFLLPVEEVDTPYQSTASNRGRPEGQFDQHVEL